jgi:putative DNA primase/helicase
MASTLDRVVGQMISCGMPEISPHELRLDTERWQRYGPQKKAYYRILRRVARSGREYFVGAFGFKGQGPYTVEYEGERLTPAEIDALRVKRERASQLEARRRANAVQAAADRARETWRSASPSGESPYLVRKQVALTGGWVRYLDDLVVVPMVYTDDEGHPHMRGVQLIRANGEKRFTSGMEKAGCCAVLGAAGGARDAILVCEGLATAASCWLALDRSLRVVVAFDAQNLAPVVERVRARHPRAPILICADDDYLTDGNPGRAKAWQASRAYDGCGVTFPSFRRRAARGATLPINRKLTDFNDLHLEQGLDDVRDQLRLALRWLGKF